MSIFHKHTAEFTRKSKGHRYLLDVHGWQQVRRNRWETWSCEVAQTLMNSPHDEERRRHMTHTDTAWKRSSEHQEKPSRETQVRGYLHRCHVVEGIVQLLAYCFVLELLSIQFVWRSEVDRKFNQVPRTAGAQKAGGETRGRWAWRGEGGKEGGKEKTNIGKVFWKGLSITETNIWFSLRLLSGVLSAEVCLTVAVNLWCVVVHRKLLTHKQAAEGL